MGLFSAVHYEVKKTKLAPGDLLVLYSDGVTEAADRADVEFGERVWLIFWRRGKRYVARIL